MIARILRRSRILRENGPPARDPGRTALSSTTGTRPAACGMVAAQLAGKGAAHPVRIVQQSSGKELGDRCRDWQRQAAGWSFGQHPRAEDASDKVYASSLTRRSARMRGRQPGAAQL
jgi:hypothetical protein